VTSLLDLLTSMTLNDLDPPKRFLVNFSRFFNAAHISTLNCDEMAEDRPRQLLGSRRPAQVGVKDRYPHSGYFTAIILCSVKTVADRHRHAAYHDKQYWQAFYWCQRRWPWMTLNFQNKGFSWFLRFPAATHIFRANCAEMARDRSGQSAYDIF